MSIESPSVSPSHPPDDQHWMQIALSEAKRAQGRTSPNPIVGCVIVHENTLLASGYHQQAGRPHAEIEALQALANKGLSAEGCTLYVNLEPCSHIGRTGPCTQAIIKAKLARVVIGVQDPNPYVNGRGIQQLRDAGIEVTVGVLAEECYECNAPFFTYIQKKRPFLSLKVAASLDAAIATRTGDAKWLSSEPARRWGHQMRDIVDAILVGANTVIADDPSLNVRMVEGVDPLRVVLDSTLRTPPQAKLYQPPLAAGTLILTTSQDETRIQTFRKQGVQVEQLPANEEGRVSLSDALAHLYTRDIVHMLIEGGGQIHGAFFQAQLVDRLYYVLTPWMLGRDARPAFQLPGQDSLANSLQFAPLQVTPLGPDLLIQATPQWDKT